MIANTKVSAVVFSGGCNAPLECETGSTYFKQEPGNAKLKEVHWVNAAAPSPPSMPTVNTPYSCHIFTAAEESLNIAADTKTQMLSGQENH